MNSTIIIVILIVLCGGMVWLCFNKKEKIVVKEIHMKRKKYTPKEPNFGKFSPKKEEIVVNPVKEGIVVNPVREGIVVNPIKSGMYDHPVANFIPGTNGLIVPSESLTYTAEGYQKVKRPLFPGGFHQGFYSDILNPPPQLTPPPYFLKNNYVGGGEGFIGSVDVGNPLFPEVVNRWRKVGLLTSTNQTDDTTLNLYKQSISGYQDWYQYSVQDKDGFIIPLPKNVTKLENGDVINDVVGKESKGPFKVNLFYENKFVVI